MIRRPPRSTLFPYTDALPISSKIAARMATTIATRPAINAARDDASTTAKPSCELMVAIVCHELVCKRSEEHTSELQSQFHLVCRLLLEKKKKTKTENKD